MPDAKTESDKLTPLDILRLGHYKGGAHTDGLHDRNWASKMEDLGYLVYQGGVVTGDRTYKLAELPWFDAAFEAIKELKRLKEAHKRGVEADGEVIHGDNWTFTGKLRWHSYYQCVPYPPDGPANSQMGVAQEVRVLQQEMSHPFEENKWVDVPLWPAPPEGG